MVKKCPRFWRTSVWTPGSTHLPGAWATAVGCVSSAGGRGYGGRARLGRTSPNCTRLRGRSAHRLVKWLAGESELAMGGAALAVRGTRNGSLRPRFLIADLPKLTPAPEKCGFCRAFHDGPRCDAWPHAVEFPIRRRDRNARRRARRSCRPFGRSNRELEDISGAPVGGSLGRPEVTAYSVSNPFLLSLAD